MNISIPENSPLLHQRDTSNPYRHAVHLVTSRLCWDMQVEAWRSRSKLRRLKNSHAGRRAVIVCNGPSLLKEDLSMLNDVYTFGLNKINLLFDKSDFRPSCIVAINPFVIEQNSEFFVSTSIPLFLDSHALMHVPAARNRTFLHISDQAKFARDCSISMAAGFTVTYVAMQLAFHMGFEKVALIGCDHNFAQTGPANAVLKGGNTDPSHFDPRYFANVAWQAPDLPGSEYFYSLARSTYDAFGRELVNATSGGRLELFPRTTLREFLSL